MPTQRGIDRSGSTGSPAFTPAQNHPEGGILGGRESGDRVYSKSYLLSLAAHLSGVLLLLLAARMETYGPKIVKAPVLPPTPLSNERFYFGNRGGGGSTGHLLPSKGSPPKASRLQIVPPTVLPPQKSRITVAQTVVDAVTAPEIAQVGDPLSNLRTLSNGTGGPGGIGTHGCCGVGDQDGPGPGGSRQRAAVTPPKLLYAPDPEFSDEARRSKYQGSVLLDVVIGTDGRIHNAKIARSLGMGLDEKALEKVKLWKFAPAKASDGTLVTVAANIEVQFNLY
ncbi:MAG TPA: energy transducer TonB [Candidatus Angelobacter sp.]|nr:energy transducer TonB [Candidatus Angelobacter sp.]